jgi:hypothetical protein
VPQHGDRPAAASPWSARRSASASALSRG